MVEIGWLEVVLVLQEGSVVLQSQQDSKVQFASLVHRGQSIASLQQVVSFTATIRSLQHELDEFESCVRSQETLSLLNSTLQLQAERPMGHCKEQNQSHVWKWMDRSRKYTKYRGLTKSFADVKTAA